MCWKQYTKIKSVSMRPYIVGEDLSGISVSKRDIPSEGGMIAMDASNPKDMWYVSEEYFKANYFEIGLKEKNIT